MLAPYHVPHAVENTILGSIGGALERCPSGGRVDRCAARGHGARSAFISGMDLALLTGAIVALAGCLLALLVLPARKAAGNDAAARTEGENDRQGPPRTQHGGG